MPVVNGNGVLVRAATHSGPVMLESLCVIVPASVCTLVPGIVAVVALVVPGVVVLVAVVPVGIGVLPVAVVVLPVGGVATAAAAPARWMSCRCGGWWWSCRPSRWWLSGPRADRLRPPRRERIDRERASSRAS